MVLQRVGHALATEQQVCLLKFTRDTLILYQHHFLSLSLRTSLSVTLGSVLKNERPNDITTVISWTLMLTAMKTTCPWFFLKNVFHVYIWVWVWPVVLETSLYASKDVCSGELTLRGFAGNCRVLCPPKWEWTPGDQGQVYTLPNYLNQKRCSGFRLGFSLYEFLLI